MCFRGSLGFVLELINRTDQTDLNGTVSPKADLKQANLSANSSIIHLLHPSTHPSILPSFQPSFTHPTAPR